MGLMVAESRARDVIYEALARAKVRQLAEEQSLAEPEAVDILPPYRFEPERYIREQMGWNAWAGTSDQPGQTQVLDAYALALRQQVERRDYEDGLLQEKDLVTWKLGITVQNFIRVEAGHTVGKTKLAAGIVNHFFDCFVPSIVYCFAPGQDQIHDLLFKEIKADRVGKGLPGRILDLALDRGHDHFVKGRATNNANNLGTERVQGQHGPHLMFVLDEAEGIPDFIWDAVDAMTSGGLVIVLMLANPRTRSSRFHKAGQRADVVSFRISETWHPNVLAGREVVPGAVRRDYVDKMLNDHCTVVEEHESDSHTFEVPWRPGIFRPDPECMFRVLGIPPANIADDTVVPLGRYEEACQREVDPGITTQARMGLDVALFGRDMGALYLRRGNTVERLEQFQQQDYFHQALRIKQHAKELAEDGVTSLHIRVDAGGGFGRGVIEHLLYDDELEKLFLEFLIVEVHFNSVAYDESAYADLATEMYFEAAESLRGLRVLGAPPELEGDLCERIYGWVNHKAIAVKKLTDKPHFRKSHGRSPDDGDGFVLAVAPDHILLDRHRQEVMVYDAPYRISAY